MGAGLSYSRHFAAGSDFLTFAPERRNFFLRGAGAGLMMTAAVFLAGGLS
jgi:hypothetical protein